MLVEDQKVIIEWSSGNKRFYIDKEYIFTKYGDKFEVELDDLSIHNTIYIKFKCDYCGEDFSKR